MYSNNTDKIIKVLSCFFIIILIVTSSSYSKSNIADKIYIAINQLIGGKLYLEKKNDWIILDEGIEYKTILFYRKDPSINIILKLIRFDMSYYYPKIIAAKNYNLGNSDVKTISERTGAIAMINGSYFDTDGNPLGYLSIDNKIINDYIATKIIYSGIFMINNNFPQIIHRQLFYPEKTESALQVGPRLISNGSSTKGIDSIDTIDFRSGAAIDRQGRLILYITDTKNNGLMWKELQDILLDPGINCLNSINLDGGGSAQLYFRTKSYSEFIEGSASVPISIGVFKKKY